MPRRRGPLDPESISQIRSLLGRGVDVETIARKYHVTRRYVESLRPPRSRGRPAVIPPAIIAQARESLARGVDVACVAREHGLSRRYVRDLAARPFARPDAEPGLAGLAELLGEDADLVALASQLTRAAEARIAAGPPAPPTVEETRRELAEFFRGFAALCGRGIGGR